MIDLCTRRNRCNGLKIVMLFVVNSVYYVVHIVCEVDVIANSLVLYLPFCSTLKKKFFSLSLSLSSLPYTRYIGATFCNVFSPYLPQFTPIYPLSDLLVDRMPWM